jgi:[ribosomal protein S5]-alanine N-acetyltransferase
VPQGAGLFYCYKTASTIMSIYSLETKRLNLRPLQQKDENDLYEILGDLETMRFYPSPMTRQEIRDWIDKNIKLNNEKGMGFFAMICKETSEFIGECGLFPQKIEAEEYVEIGYQVKRKYWRKGFASEAATGCRDYAFKNLGMNKLISLVRPENLEL